MVHSQHFLPVDRDFGSQKYWDSETFASLLPVFYALIIGGIVVSTYGIKFQVVYFMLAWLVAALSIMRIQQLIHHYSQGRYHYQTGTCALLLGSVVLAPWLWLYIMDVLFETLVKSGVIANNHTSWVCTFTLGATGFALMAVTPIIEGWYELLRGSFSFDGHRIKSFKPSLKTQLLLFSLFAGILLLPATLISTHPAYVLDKGDTTYLYTGFCCTFVALIWLVDQLERIRQIQLSIYRSSHAPIDQALINRQGPLSNNIHAPYRSPVMSLMARKNQPAYAGPHLGYPGTKSPGGSLASSFRSARAS
jgi:hypothetical protein